MWDVRIMASEKKPIVEYPWCCILQLYCTVLHIHVGQEGVRGVR